MHHAVSTLFVRSGITFNKTDTTVLDTEMENNINDQESSRNDADCV